MIDPIGSTQAESDKQGDATFYVATDGDNRWSGKLPAPNAERTDGPFATLQWARDAVRALKAKGLKEPLTVAVRGGKYFLDRTFVLSEQDSGTQDCPITYTAHPGEKPILSGGRKVTGWKRYQGRILQAELSGSKGGKWNFRQLFFNGERMPRARWPKADPENPLYTGWAFMEGPAEEGSATAFRYKPGTFRQRWAKPTEAEVNVYAGVDCTMKTVPVKSIDYEQRIVTLAYESWNLDISPWYIPMPFLPENRFCVENVLEELDQPGEWCFDSGKGVLYFWPPSDALEEGEVVVPALDRLADLHGAAWITISGFTFTETLDGDNLHPDGTEGCGAMAIPYGPRYCGEALRLRGASHCAVADNHFYAVGGNGIYLEDRNTRNVIQYNEISFAGANGVCLAGSEFRHPTFNEICDNYIHHCGVLNKYVAGVFCGASDGNLISHNRIEYLPHHAINLADNPHGRNVVEYNEIRFACQEVTDNGAINSWMEKLPRDGERCGHIIRYNLIADTMGYEVVQGVLRASTHFPTSDMLHAGTHYPTSGIYLDNYTSNCFVYGNIILRCKTTGVFIHAGKNNVIENNIVVDCGCLASFGEWVSWLYPYWRRMLGFQTGNQVIRNIFCQTGADTWLYILAHWTEQVLLRSDENVFFGTDGWPFALEHLSSIQDGVTKPVEELEESQRIDSLEKWQRLGYDRHSVFADPIFVDPANDDYRLRPDSPAFALGFQPVDTGNIGIRKRR